MDALRKYAKLVNFLNQIILIIVMLSLFVFVFLTYYERAVFFFKGNFIIIFLYVVILLVLAAAYRCLRIGILTTGELIYSCFIAVLITNIIMYIVICLIAREIMNPSALACLSLAQTFIGALFYWYANKIFFLLYPARDCVAIGRDSGLDIITFNKFHQLKTRFNIHVILDEREGFENLKWQLDHYSTVVLGDIDLSLRTKLIEYCFEKDICLYVIPNISDVMMHNAHETQIDDSLVYLCRNEGPSTEQLLVKRILDIVCSIIGLVISIPIMPIIAIFIKAYDGGPVFIKQKRLTLNGREFNLIKFRSMIVNAEQDGKARLASYDDKRITPVGKVIRTLRFDELPQLFNILKGDMALVGPRPERPEIMQEYIKDFPAFEYRLKMKAGLTGYAQIYGKYNTPFEDKVKLDIVYVLRYSILNDIKIIIATIKTIFKKSSSQGVMDEAVSMREKEDKYWS